MGQALGRAEETFMLLRQQPNLLPTLLAQFENCVSLFIVSDS